MLGRRSMNRPTTDPSQGDQAFVRALSVPLLGGVKGWVHGPNAR